MPIRYAITHINSKLGLRQLTLPNQGRHHFDDKDEAQGALEALKPGLKEKILGADADTLEVRPVDCYDHGDAKGIYFDL